MSLFDLTKRRWLFCMTHPDDEISICIWIKRLTENGNEVFMSWTHSNETREKEARSVAELLGVPQVNLFFHEGPDGHVCKTYGELLPQFREMMVKVQPDVVVCGAFEQGHVDHDTTNVLVNQTFDGPVLEVPFYHTYMTKLQKMNEFSDTAGQEVLVMTPDEVRLKREVAKRFKSQNIWSVLLWSEIWGVSQGKPIQMSRREVARLQHHKTFRIPNHPTALASKLEKHETWQWWCDHVLPHVRG